ncbi:MAG: spermidine synthase [Myxococcota bacterium]
MSNIEYLESEESSLGIVCLRKRELLSRPGMVVHELTLDHHYLMSTCNTASERALASRSIETHGGRDLDVLVGGLGLGYTAAAVLESPAVRHLEVVEFLSPVVDWVRDGRVPLSPVLLADDRFHTRVDDVYGELWAPPERQWDLVLVDVDHSPEEPLGRESERFYSEAGLRHAKAHLKPGGILGVWSHAPCAPFVARLEGVFERVWTESIDFRNPLLDPDEAAETNWLFFARA